MRTLRLFVEWFVKRYMDSIFATSALIAIVLGIPFAVVDLTPQFEGLRFGWFYSTARIPVYSCAVIAASLLLWVVGSLTVEWLREQKEDFKRFIERHQG